MDEAVWRTDSNFGLLHRPMLEDLSRDQLLPIVAAMAGEPVTDFRWEIDWPQEGKEGSYGRKLIPRFTWTTGAGQVRTARCG